MKKQNEGEGPMRHTGKGGAKEEQGGIRTPEFQGGPALKYYSTPGNLVYPTARST